VAGEVLGDGARLRQVLDNLLTNAVKFTAPGGRVTVGVAREARSIVITVDDSGRGIAPESLARLFEPFTQTDVSPTRANDGLGLGLAIAKQIVALHHGELTAASAGPGRGTTFTLRLPLTGARRAVSPAAGVAYPPTLEAIRVLIVDDDRRVRSALALLLQRLGAVIDTAESAPAARAQIEAHAPDIILCDIAMPGEDGHRLIRGLRASGSQIPAIALTAYAMESDAESARASGFDLHVAKPIDFERMVVTIAALVAGRRSAAAPA
jgi:CheY-like chemotaxis protein/anti-sigma regulatory factor (Ser/Thr protein kinase)